MSKKKIKTIYCASTVETISSLLNAPEDWDCGLTEMLQEKIEWSEVNPETIIPKLELRRFTKSIDDKEVRLDVMKFLFDYAEYYFYDGAKKLSHARLGNVIIESEAKEITAEYIREFRTELSTQISQIEKTGMYSGDRFSKLEKQVAQLTEENEQYKKANKFLQDKIDRFENPHKYGKFIPAELNNRIFVEIMRYLQAKQLVLPLYPEKDYTRGISCYQWYGSCALFGYFVWKLNQEFDLNEARDLLNWQVFETAINNYNKLINEARKAVSKFRKDDKALLPVKADIIEEAIRYANGDMKNAEIRENLNI